MSPFYVIGQFHVLFILSVHSKSDNARTPLPGLARDFKGPSVISPNFFFLPILSPFF